MAGKIIVFTSSILSISIVLIALIIRSYAFQIPIMGDEAVYSILGKKAIMGERIYVDFYEFKPPLLFYMYGLGSKLFGWSIFGLRALGLSLVLCNSAMVCFLAKKYTSLSLSIAISGISLFLMNNIYSYGPETVAEHFVIFFLLSGFLVLEYLPIKKSLLNYLIAGFLICGAAMIKQTAALFGLMSVIYLLLRYLINQKKSNLKKIALSIIFLGLGAIFMVILNIVPIWLSSSFVEAKYWLFEVTNQYVKRLNFSDSLLYLEVYGGRIFKYQMVTIILLLVSLLSMVFTLKKKYFLVVSLLVITALINIFPGFRFYGQYWLPLLLLLPLSVIGIHEALTKLRQTNIQEIIVPLIFLIGISADSLIHRTEYFDGNYELNAEKAHSGNFRTVYGELSKDIKKRMQPGESFIMLGPQAYTYFDVNRFPNIKHIFPRNVSRNTPQNKIYQREAFASYSEYNYDYLILSVTGIAWSGSDDFDDWLYQRTFANTLRNYDPIWVFNADEGRYYNAEAGETVDLYKGNQIISFKKK